MNELNDSYQAFGVLLGTIDRDRSVTLTTMPALPGNSLRLGVDPGWNRHILAHIPEDFAFSPRHDAATELAEWTEPGTGQRFLDLICRDDALSQVFSALADNVIRSVKMSGMPAYEVLLQLLDQWRRLFRPARHFSENEMRGLFGELWVLSLLAKQNPFFALDSWRGPRGDAHDFIAPRGQLEVKSSKREGLDVTISSLAQLDRAPGTSLGLVRLHIDSSPDGQGIDDMVEKLTGMGCPRATVIESIGAMGFLVGVDADDFRFIVPTPPLAWHVTDDFPGLRSTDLPEDRREAITQLKYSLNLIGAPGQMSSDEFDSYTEAMMSK